MDISYKNEGLAATVVEGALLGNPEIPVQAAEVGGPCVRHQDKLLQGVTVAIDR